MVVSRDDCGDSGFVCIILAVVVVVVVVRLVLWVSPDMFEDLRHIYIANVTWTFKITHVPFPAHFMEV